MAALGALGLFVGLGIPVVGAGAAGWMVAYFIVATAAHLIRKDMASLAAPLVFLAVFVLLVVVRWADAKPLLAFVGL